MCPANCIAPQRIVADGERRDVFHPEAATAGVFLDRPFLLRVRGERRRRRRGAEKELAPGLGPFDGAAVRIRTAAPDYR
jgi:hypothetical protein